MRIGTPPHHNSVIFTILKTKEHTHTHTHTHMYTHTHTHKHIHTHRHTSMNTGDNFETSMFVPVGIIVQGLKSQGYLL